jgi:hypothetical protein
MSKNLFCMVCVCAVTSACLVVPSFASSHPTSWYWGEGRAEFKFETRYDVAFVTCIGYGRSIRGSRGGRLYKHFLCDVENWDGTREEDELHVLGKRRFIVYD